MSGHLDLDKSRLARGPYTGPSVVGPYRASLEAIQSGAPVKHCYKSKQAQGARDINPPRTVAKC